jgi:hypothetical protein
MAVAATTDTTRVFLWGMVFSWSIMAGSEGVGVVSRSRGNHLGKLGDYEGCAMAASGSNR